MAQLTFKACIFSGIVCNECGTALDNGNMKPTRLQQHRSSCNPTMMLDAKAQLDRVKEILDDSAKVLLACNTDEKKAKFCELFLKDSVMLWCDHESCNRAYKNERQHSGGSRTQHRQNNHFSQKMIKHPKDSASLAICFAEEEWNYANYQEKFSTMFQSAIDSVPNDQIPLNAFMATALQINIRNRNGMPMQRPADNLFQPEDNCMTTDILRAVQPDGPSRMPKASKIFTETSAEQEYDIGMATCLGNEESYLRAAKLYEIEFLAARKGDHKTLMQFLSEIGIRNYVCTAFGGSYARFTQFASIYSSPAGALWEKCLERAFFQFFQLGNEQVEHVSPTVVSVPRHHPSTKLYGVPMRT
jgi:hypothetical protein